MKRALYCIFSLFFIGMLYHSCTYEKVKIDNNITNEKLYNLINEPGFAFYQNTPDTLSAAGDSPHGVFRLRFNAKAQSVLDGSGKLPVGGTFPDSSLVVKEMYLSKGGALIAYEVLYKNNKSPYANGGWVWGEFYPDGSISESIFKKGENCIGCHSGGTNRNYLRSFDLH